MAFSRRGGGAGMTSPISGAGGAPSDDLCVDCLHHQTYLTSPRRVPGCACSRSPKHCVTLCGVGCEWFVARPAGDSCVDEAKSLSYWYHCAATGGAVRALSFAQAASQTEAENAIREELASRGDDASELHVYPFRPGEDTPRAGEGVTPTPSVQLALIPDLPRETDMDALRNTILVGDCLAMLRTLPDQCVHLCVTSPPYWGGSGMGLRDYGTALWEGGDPECEHKPVPSADVAKAVATSTLAGGFKTTGHQQEGYPRECPRCGAVRVDEQLGMEPIHDCNAWARGEPPCGGCFVCSMRSVFAEVWRVLRDDSVLVLNVGDSYAAKAICGRPNVWGAKSPAANVSRGDRCVGGLKPKDLAGVPWRTALALQADGWTLRSAPNWVKANVMPESCRDRPTTSHEYIFLFAKGPRYYWDPEAVSVPLAASSVGRLTQDTFDQQTGGPKDYGHRTNANRSARKAVCNLREKLIAQEKWGDRHAGWEQRDKSVGRNLRTGDLTRWSMEEAILALMMQAARLGVALQDGGLALDEDGDPLALLVNPQPFKGQHFATFPPRLVRPFVLAGTSEAGCCPSCAAPWVRVVQRGNSQHHCRPGCGCGGPGQDWGEGWKGYGGFGNTVASSDQWRPSCACSKLTDCAKCDGKGWKVRNPLASAREHRRAIVAALRAGAKPPIPSGRKKVWCPWCLGAGYPRKEWGETVPALILDPFMGAGTTGLVARKHGRDYVGIELNPEYAAMASTRIEEALRAPAEVAAEATRETVKAAGQLALLADDGSEAA